MNKEKHKWIVSLRSMACLSIVLLHVIGCWLGFGISPYDALGGGISRGRLIFDQIFIQVLVRWAVPCFVMISGYLILDPNRDMPVSKIWRYIKRMLYSLLTFGLFYCLIQNVLDMGIGNPVYLIISSVKNLIEGNCWGHMWYVYMMIGLYILTPIIRGFVARESKHEVWFVLVLLFLLTIVIPTINLFFSLSIARFVMISMPYLFYYIAGYYIPRLECKRNAMVIILLGGVVGFVIMLILRLQGYNVSVDSDNAFVAMYSMALYYFASNCDKLEIIANNIFIEIVSEISFAVYLIHPFFLNLVMKGAHIYPSILPLGVGELVFWIGTCAITIISVVILRKMKLLWFLGI